MKNEQEYDEYKEGFPSSAVSPFDFQCACSFTPWQQKQLYRQQRLERFSKYGSYVMKPIKPFPGKLNIKASLAEFVVPHLPFHLDTEVHF